MIRAAVIGLRMGANHARAYANHPETGLWAICDPDEGRLAQVGDAYDVPVRVKDYRELLAVEELDCCNVCSPDHFHAEQTIALLEAGIHVLCEKPMAPTLEECQAMVDASRRTGRKLMIGQSYRFQNRFRAVKALVEAGEVGTPYLVESEYWNNLEGVGGVGNWRNDPRIRHPFVGGCHAMDLCRWIAGEVVQVQALANHLAYLEQPTDDCIIAQVQFQSGCLGRVLVSSGCKRPFLTTLDVHGTAGSIVDLGITHSKTEDFAPLPGFDPAAPANDSIADEVAAFVECLLADGPIPVPAEDGLGTMAACFAVMESSQTGQPVQLL